MDKIDRLLDAIEHPDRYSDKEIETMLADKEIREVYDLLDKTESTLNPISAPDIDAEWDAFKTSHRVIPKRSILRIPNMFIRNIAASIAIVIASIAVVATVVGVSVKYALNQQTEETAAETSAVARETAVPDDSIVTAGEALPTAPQTIVFDNEPLEDIANSIARYYGYKLAFSPDAPRSLRLYFRWNQAQTLDDVVESLDNFEQIHISVNDKTINID